MAYSTGPYAKFSTLPVLPRPILVAARKIDFATGRYVLDATTGGYTSMPSVSQQVILLVSFAVEPREFITDVDDETTRQDVLAALLSLSDSSPPVIDRVDVTVGSDVKGTSSIQVNFRDLSTGLDESVQLK